MFINWQAFGKAGCLLRPFKIPFPHWNRKYDLLQGRSQWLTEQGLTNSYKLLDCLQSSFSFKILLVLSLQAPLQTTTLCYNKGLGRDFFLLVLTPSFIAASPLACLGFACSNFAKKNKRLLAVYKLQVRPFEIIYLRNLVLTIDVPHFRTYFHLGFFDVAETNRPTYLISLCVKFRQNSGKVKQIAAQF